MLIIIDMKPLVKSLNFCVFIKGETSMMPVDKLIEDGHTVRWKMLLIKVCLHVSKEQIMITLHSLSSVISTN